MYFIELLIQLIHDIASNAEHDFVLQLAQCLKIHIPNVTLHYRYHVTYMSIQCVLHTVFDCGTKVFNINDMFTANQ